MHINTEQPLLPSGTDVVIQFGNAISARKHPSSESIKELTTETILAEILWKQVFLWFTMCIMASILLQELQQILIITNVPTDLKRLAVSDLYISFLVMLLSSLFTWKKIYCPGLLIKNITDCNNLHSFYSWIHSFGSQDFLHKWEKLGVFFLAANCPSPNRYRYLLFSAHLIVNCSRIILEVTFSKYNIICYVKELFGSKPSMFLLFKTDMKLTTTMLHCF